MRETLFGSKPPPRTPALKVRAGEIERGEQAVQKAARERMPRAQILALQRYVPTQILATPRREAEKRRASLRCAGREAFATRGDRKERNKLVTIHRSRLPFAEVKGELRATLRRIAHQPIPISDTRYFAAWNAH